MENQSQNQTPRRPRGNRSSGRSRNRQGNQSRQGGPPHSSSRKRSRPRKRSGGSRRRSPKLSFWQRLLSFFGLGSSGQGASKKSSSPKKDEAPKARQSAPKAQVLPEGEARKAKRQRTEVTSPRLYVGNLDYSTGEAELEELFKGVGHVRSAEVVTNPRTQQSKGFAFVEMGSIDEARRAVGTLDDQEFMGRRLIVSGARSEGASAEGRSSLVSPSSEEID